MSLVVPVLPATGRPSAATGLPVPRWITLSSMLVIRYAVSGRDHRIRRRPGTPEHLAVGSVILVMKIGSRRRPAGCESGVGAGQHRKRHLGRAERDREILGDGRVKPKRGR